LLLPGFVAKESTDKPAEGSVQDTPDAHLLLTFPAASLTYSCSLESLYLLRKLRELVSYGFITVSDCQRLPFFFLNSKYTA